MKSEKTLLLVDAIINLALGVFLGVFPEQWVEALGMPVVPNPFYASILGGVLFGIGIALLLERSRERSGQGGLNLSGAVAINLCGGLVLAAWLLFGDLNIPPRGRIIMGSLVGLLLVLSAMELVVRIKDKPKPQRTG